MIPGPKPLRDTLIADFSEILRPTDGSEPPVIVGGHAVNLWAHYFLSKGVGELARYMPFTSKDLDLVGTNDLLDRLNKRWKGKLSHSEPRSPVLGRVLIPSTCGKDLAVEVLHTVRGLDLSELGRTLDLEADKVFGRVLMPHLVLKAKIENVITLDQMDRNDVKHVGMMILSVRAFVGELATEVASGEFGARTLVNFLGEIWGIVTSRQAETSSQKWGFDFSNIWPLEELRNAGNVKITKWLQHRFPSNSN